MAQVFAPWLKRVIQTVDFTISTDMERGVQWLGGLDASLNAHSIGILCVTPENVGAPWLNFEAGALSRQIGDDVRVIPYLMDFNSPSDLETPMGQFNAALADRDGTFEVVKTLANHSEVKISDADLLESFDLRWPALYDSLEGIRLSNQTGPSAKRDLEDKVNEALGLLRTMERDRLYAPSPPPRAVSPNAKARYEEAVTELLVRNGIGVPRFFWEDEYPDMPIVIVTEHVSHEIEKAVEYLGAQELIQGRVSVANPGDTFIHQNNFLMVGETPRSDMSGPLRQNHEHDDLDSPDSARAQYCEDGGIERR